MKRIMLFISAALLFAACSGPLKEKEPAGKEYSRVVILVSEGCNSLSGYLESDIAEITAMLPNMQLPADGSNRAFFIISHFPQKTGDYRTPTSPHIIRLSRDFAGRPVRDTVLTMDEGTVLTKSENLRSALSFIRDNYPSDSYGLILSSHGSGWLPPGYYDSGSGMITPLSVPETALPDGAVRYNGPFWPDGIAVKSFAQEIVSASDGKYSFEMSLHAIAEAIPMKMDYILFDACLMGGIETAGELRNVPDRRGVSQAEVLADGFCYETVLDHLLNESPANPEGVCQDYYRQYQAEEGTTRCSATISLIDCTELDGLARVCTELFSTYRNSIDTLQPHLVQGFFRYNKHWFYDLEDILVQAGISEADHARLTEALNRCVIYKDATEQFMGAFRIRTFCGLSMYLPSDGNSYLDSYYSELGWNKATHLVD